MRISPSRIDYYQQPDKAALKIKGKSLTKPVNGLKSRIPIRAFYTSTERKTPGFIQIDTVHHCGQLTNGEYSFTLTAADIFSGWINLYALLHKAFKRTFEALRDITNTLPFPLLEFHSDNGAEFINHAAEKVTTQNIRFRLRDRETTRKTATPLWNRKTGRLFVSMPAMKLVGKTRMGSKEIKKYGEAKSPYQRLMDPPALESAVKERLKRTIALYNPVSLSSMMSTRY
jgi:hypothetical protein